MNFFTYPSLVLIIFDSQLSTIVAIAKLSAVNNSIHAVQLYLKVRNEEGPSERDPARTDPKVRKQICKDITRSGFFELYGMSPVKMKKTFLQLQDPDYSDFFRRIYNATSTTRTLSPLENALNLHRPAYINSYERMEFDIFGFTVRQHFVPISISESVFVCLLKNKATQRLEAHYVSKEYNISGNPYKAGRFIFEIADLNHARVLFESIVKLAEEPAEVREGPDFHIELEYLEIRKYRRQAISDDLDPLCKLFSQKMQDNQHYRLCVAVLRSSYYKAEATYPSLLLRATYNNCFENQVFFKTKKAVNKANGKLYYERMTKCHSKVPNSNETISIYISRGYKSNQVFVYKRNPSDDRIYLENLCTNVSILDHDYFEDVED